MWLPGYERHEYPGLAGKPYQYTHNPKGCLHTTEGGSIAGAMSAYAPYPPHLIYDWRYRRGVQHVRLDRASYSAMDGNDDDYMIQVELVGFAAETRNWSEQALRNVAADVVAPLERLFKIPRRIIGSGFKDGRDGMVLASANSPIRLSAAGLRDFSGWLGHQHLPAPDTHWDPGALPMAKILSYLEDDMPLTQADRDAIVDDIKNRVLASNDWRFDGSNIVDFLRQNKADDATVRGLLELVLANSAATADEVAEKLLPRLTAQVVQAVVGALPKDENGNVAVDVNEQQIAYEVLRGLGNRLSQGL